MVQYRFARLAASLALLAPSLGAQVTTRVSVGPGAAQANNGSAYAAVSADGRYVAFVSGASNLVAGASNTFVETFVHDRVSATTTRVSVSSSGMQADGHCYTPAISGDGRHVAFRSSATNLVPGDTNSLDDIFVHDRQTAQTTRVSVSSSGAQTNDGGSSQPAISADGRCIAFSSPASTLVSGDTMGYQDVFVHDRQTGQTARVSVDSSGTQANTDSGDPSISGDGRYVAFTSSATNLVPSGTNGYEHVYVHDRQTGSTTVVDAPTPSQVGDLSSLWPSISADGRYVAFWSVATNLVPGDTNGLADFFVHDRQTLQIVRVSVDSSGAQGNGNSWLPPSLSADGRFVAFASHATNLVTGDTNGRPDVFLHDLQTGETTRASVSSSGAEADADSYESSVSADGRYVAFHSDATNLVPGDTNGYPDVFVRDRTCAALVYVDCAFTGVENGTYDEPFNTVGEALLAACSGGEIVMKASVCTAAPLTISMPVTLKSTGGPSTVR